MIDLFLSRYVYLLIVILLALGIYGMLGKHNLLKKLIDRDEYFPDCYLSLFY